MLYYRCSNFFCSCLIKIFTKAKGHEIYNEEKEQKKKQDT